MDYLHKLDSILEIIGMKVKPHATSDSHHDSLQQWVSANKKSSSQLRGSSAQLPVNQENVEMAEEAGVLIDIDFREEIFNKVSEYVSVMIDNLFTSAMQEAKRFITEDKDAAVNTESLAPILSMASFPSSDSGLGNSEVQEEGDSQ